ncbi:MAG: type I-C CRISPR-associated protein Cas8c/Csd1 [Acutalibacteraceae bacterium]
MLIKSLCDYHDMLPEKDKTSSKGYGYVEIMYTVFLKEDGTISSISNCQKAIEYTDKKGKPKVKYEPKQVLFPKREEKTSLNAEFIDCRSKYATGLAFNKGKFEIAKGKSGSKEINCFDLFKEKNLKFIDGIDSPVVNAYRNFILNWNPENELENEHLLPLGTDFKKAKFEFRLRGDERLPSLQDDEQIKHRWETQYFNKNSSDVVIAQCGIYGEKEEIAQTHNKIKKLDGGEPTGCTLVCFNNKADESYGKTQSYNSNISVKAMEKYTKALNYLILSEKNKMMVDDINIIYWSCDKDSGEKCEEMFDNFLKCEFDDKMESEDIKKFLKELLSEAKSGKINFDKISDNVVRDMNENADFYIVGLKPNSSRIAIKFFYKNKFGKLMYNIAKHQRDIQISSKEDLVSLYRIVESSMIPEKSEETEINPEIMSQIFKTIIYGGKYPELLLNMAIRRFKSAHLKDDDKKSKAIYSSNQKLRAGLIKACLTRKSKNKEEFKVSLDSDNKNTAYLCGRLFAVLEKIQKDSASKELNRTIKDSYFSSACSRPSSVFPQILKLSSHHLAKLDDKSKIYYNKLISGIIDNISGEFPNHLYLDDQGRFIIGYYQQNNALYTSKAKKEDNENMNINEFEEED